jgi:uncharacterized membrane protein YheB (UPF0754 family)
VLEKERGVMDFYVILTPVTGALIGYITNWIAVKMLFRPYREKRLFGLRLPFTPGVIPKERLRLARAVGQVVEQSLLTPDVIMAAVTSSDAANRIAEKIMARFRDSDESGETVDSHAERLLGDDCWNEVKSAAKTVIGELSDKTVRSASDALLDYMKKSPAMPVLIPLACRIFDAVENDDAFNAWLVKAVRGFFDNNVSHFVGVFISKEKIAGNIKRYIEKILEDDALLKKTEPTLYEIALRCDANFDEKLQAFIENGVKGDSLKSVFSRVDAGGVLAMIDESVIKLVINAALNVCASFAADNIRISGFVEARINGFSVEESEKLTLSVIRKELGMITALGGVLGFLIGLATLLFRNI